MNWMLLALFGLILFFGINFMFMRGRRAPDVLNEEGWPKAENRSGKVPNDEE